MPVDPDDPEDGKAYKLSLGDSFKGAASDSGFYTLRYDFKPASLNRDKPGVLVIGSENDIGVEFEAGPDKPPVSFQGNFVPAKEDSIDCVLVFDGQGFTIEQLAGQVPSLRQSRNPTFRRVSENVRREAAKRQRGEGYVNAQTSPEDDDSLDDPPEARAGSMGRPGASGSGLKPSSGPALTGSISETIVPVGNRGRADSHPGPYSLQNASAVVPPSTTANEGGGPSKSSSSSSSSDSDSSSSSSSSSSSDSD
eukprot:CAMPEP_0198201966 /NCGR_PEP_ID=MMETSP1445-20131203/5003_1 /TAXON_ID=36898 /ORGANISM="Pyramimonas sp., Strain CCMP2087" /LENGTH=251 /DNA_ID=CAMNT_0043872653 /DNA_START=393 /DNA_END=1148 /DNA_ORIENTATION=-